MSFIASNKDMFRANKQPHKYSLIDPNQKLTVIQPSATAGQHSVSRWIVWRLCNAAMVIFFSLAALVQINDPDPFIWIPVYLIPAVLSAAIVAKPSVSENFMWRLFCVVHIAVCIGGIIYLAVVVSQLIVAHMKNPLIFEEGRELAGLIIVICWLTIGRFSGFGSTEPKRGVAAGVLVISCILGLAPLFVWSLCFIEPLNALTHCMEMKTAGSATPTTPVSVTSAGVQH